MLAVISSPHPVKNEAGIINSLFKAGLFHFHLRKPAASLTEVKELLAAIDPEYYQRIALHHHHALALETGLTRLHFTEDARLKTDKIFWRELVAAGFRLSTSLHDVEAARSLSTCFSYAFLGPVFDSISKTGYRANVNLCGCKQVTEAVSPLIAIGGIDKHNCTKPLQMGFKGVAVLGAIWEDNSPLEAFRDLKDQWLSDAKPLFPPIV
ncbi:thiamine phosphate synthase [Filimonas effusa]|uniref:Thiamine phosphate synthase n=1 Tax=Filimonas effusa TaxID=2508721 RepID=A0A4Q1D0L4_9BACT|nr:thiamine phosphate synthase [Filimonas effusa]RXK80764.1 thiamine phosphate synthase [Filimonas effusa]